ncbi:MAG: TetR/AcrR family transcriptional regulator [Burkholderiaceae bacterium]|nr:TetR/AcrR family transcriptional regulator [Burkholderiaceae bacterium]
MKTHPVPNEVPAKPARRCAGRPRAADVEARMQALLQTAAALFLEHGYSKVSLEMIARAARVAIRTIYVKFGGKAGLVGALIEAKRDSYMSGKALLTDPRPVRVALGEFSRQLHTMLHVPESQALRRMIAAEGKDNPELVDSFYRAGPGITLELLRAYFDRADVRAQLRDDLPFEQLPVFFINCVVGDTLARSLDRPTGDASEAAMDARMALFFRAVLK